LVHRARISPLPVGKLGLGESVLPAKTVPIGHSEAEGENVRSSTQGIQVRVGGRTRGATLALNQFDDDRVACVSGSRAAGPNTDARTNYKTAIGQLSEPGDRNRKRIVIPRRPICAASRRSIRDEHGFVTGKAIVTSALEICRKSKTAHRAQSLGLNSASSTKKEFADR
jgi:hypothetical protein